MVKASVELADLTVDFLYVATQVVLFVEGVYPPGTLIGKSRQRWREEVDFLCFQQGGAFSLTSVQNCQRGNSQQSRYFCPLFSCFLLLLSSWISLSRVFVRYV